MQRLAVLTLLFAATLATSLGAQEINLPPQNISLTIYNQNLALVRDVRNVNLPVGLVDVAFEGVAKQMQPATAMIEGKGLNVLETNYEYDVLDYSSLLDKYVGQKVKTVMSNPANGENIFASALLLNASYGSPLLQFDYGIEANFPGRVVFEKLPRDLRLKPTLSAKIQNENPQNMPLELSYLTSGMSWKADYVAEIAADDNMDIEGFITLSNQSGIDYKNAEVQVVSGELSVPSTPQVQPRMLMMAAKNSYDAAESVATGGNLSPENLGDYYIYTLPFKTDIRNKQSKQVQFVRSAFKYQSLYRLNSSLNAVYGGVGENFKNLKPSLYYVLVNEQQSNLPQGDIRFFEKDDKGNLQFAGGTSFPQLAKGEKTELEAGKVGDIFADGKLVALRKIADKVTEKDFEITVHNTKNKVAKLEFIQQTYGDVSLVKESLPHASQEVGKFVWELEIPANGSLVLTYTLRMARD